MTRLLKSSPDDLEDPFKKTPWVDPGRLVPMPVKGWGLERLVGSGIDSEVRDGIGVVSSFGEKIFLLCSRPARVRNYDRGTSVVVKVRVELFGVTVGISEGTVCKVQQKIVSGTELGLLSQVSKIIYLHMTLIKIWIALLRVVDRKRY